MKLQSATIREFKRFKDLSIDRLPARAKLIMVLGPNGCGKSSLFDAFQRALKVDQFYGMSNELRRHYQRATPGATADSDEVHLEFHGNNPSSEEDLKRSLYVRSAYRHDPSFDGATIQQPNDILDRHAVRRLIDTDQTVRDNFQRMIWRLMRRATTPGLTTDQIMVDTIGDVQQSMKLVFGDIAVDALVSIDEKGTFTFTKGASKSFLYENLSAGEKAAFDLLLDLVVNRVAFHDSLYCIDEPEAHLNTRVQSTLLKELFRLTPENSQLWVATHSIGMLRAPQDLRAESGPEQVVFLDMGFSPDGTRRDYDQPQTVEPSEPGHGFWKRHYVIALEDMAELLAPDRIVLCEGAGDGAAESLDEACYNRIFAGEFPGTRFVSVGASSTVEKRMRDLLPVLERVVGASKVVLFRDRDDSTPEEVRARQVQQVVVRTMSEYRNIEAMLLSDGVLVRLCESVEKADRIGAIRAARDSALDGHQGDHPGDDLKPAAQAVHHAARNELGLLRSGQTKHAFMRDVLAPLVATGTPEYESLKRDIFGETAIARSSSATY